MIVLDNFYTIDWDANCWTLYYSKTSDEINPETGKPIVSHGQWYYASFTQALKNYVDRSMRANESITEMLIMLIALDTKIDNLFKEYRDSQDLLTPYMIKKPAEEKKPNGRRKKKEPEETGNVFSPTDSFSDEE